MKKGKRGNVVNIRGRKKPPPNAKSRGGKPSPTTAPPPSDDNIRASFLHHLTSWNQVQAKMKAAEKLKKDMIAAAKADGFLKKELEVAEALAGSPKQEAKITGEVSLRLRVARWMGHAMGNQLDLFAEPDRTPAVDKAYDEGKQACMSHERASPPYAPGIPQYTRWLMGYHDEQERQVKAGIKKLGGNGNLDDGPGDPDGDGNPVAAVGAPDPARPLSDFDDPPSDAKH